VDEIECLAQIKYVRAGLLDTSPPPVFHTRSEIPSFGFANRGVSVGELHYLIVPLGTDVVAPAIRIRDGSVRYDVTMLTNRESIDVRPAGEFEGRCIIQGDISCISDDPTTQNLYKACLRALKRQFVRRHSLWIGINAMEKVRAGYFLTDDVRNPQMSIYHDRLA